MSIPARNLPAVLALLAIVVLGTAGIIWLARGEETPVERSAIGHRGLLVTLRSDGIEARYAGYERFTSGADVLRILPLLDTDLDVPFERPKADEDYLATGTERDISSWVLSNKLDRLDTLLIAPKWTRAMRHSGYAHASLLLPADAASRGLRDMDLLDKTLIRPETPVLSFTTSLGRGPELVGLLYAPQLFPTDLKAGCAPRISTPQGHLLVTCPRGQRGRPVHILSDPDLLNSHGLSLADNARIARAITRELAPGAPVLIDGTDTVFTFDEPAELDRRSWSDILRVFSYPYSLAWWGLLAFSVALLWRSWRRFGPIATLFRDEMSAARAASIAAKARLLRLAGNDPQLFRTHALNRIRSLEEALFGRVGPGDGLTRIVTYLERNDPTLAAGFARAASAATNASAGASIGELMGALDEFERQAERVLHGT